MSKKAKKRVYSILITGFIVSMFACITVSAAKIDVGTGNTDILTIVEDIAKILTGTAYEIIKYLITVFAVVIIAWNAFSWYTNQTPQANQKMKTSMATGVIAIVLVWAAPYLVGWIKDALNTSTIA